MSTDRDDVILEGTDITAGYGGKPVLHDISIDVRSGKITSIIGPNGAGKSTLLKTLFGFVTPTSGTITLGGEDVTNTPPERMVETGICYVFQRDNIFSGMTVHENLEMATYTQPDMFEERIDSVYEIFPRLGERKQQKGGSLSGGEQQMLALACGLMLDPEVLFVDEPSAALAPTLIDTVFERLESINEHGTTLLLVEQNVQRVLEISDTVFVLENGQNRFEGTPDELAENEELMDIYL